MGGKVHIFGQQYVEMVIELAHKAIVTHLRFVKGIYLVGLDTKGIIHTWALDTNQQLYEYQIPNKVTAIETDPSLDWLLLGLESGEILVFDVDRGELTPTKIENIQKTILPKEKLSPVISIAWHPRDIGTILIAYEKLAVVYSIAIGQAGTVLRYEVPEHAPGGEFSNESRESTRCPTFNSAVWHPEGNHVLTAHQDGTLVFWDAKDSKLLQARTLSNINVNIPIEKDTSDTINVIEDSPKVTPAIKQKTILKVALNCGIDPSNTSLLVLSKDITFEGRYSLAMLYFGPTPNVLTTSYDQMGLHYANPKFQKVLPLVNQANISDFLMIPSEFPFSSGNHDPSAVFILHESGEISTLTYPTGTPITKISLLPLNLSSVCPRITCSISVSIPKIVWKHMIDAVEETGTLLKGGSSIRRNLIKGENKTITITGHADGSVRFREAFPENDGGIRLLDIETSQVIGRAKNKGISYISFAVDSCELAVATELGEVVLYKFQENLITPQRKNSKATSVSAESITSSIQSSTMLVDIQNKASLWIKEGFMPQTLVRAPVVQSGGPIIKVTALNNSSIGYLSIAYSNGELMVIDRGGRSIIYHNNLSDTNIPKIKSSSKNFKLGHRHSVGTLYSQSPSTSASSTAQQRSSINHPREETRASTMRAGTLYSPQASTFNERDVYGTSLEFAIMTVGDELYTSVILLVGTNTGDVGTFKILRHGTTGAIRIKLAGYISVGSRPIKDLIPYDIDTGVSTIATRRVMEKLPGTLVIHGAVITTTKTEIRIFKPYKSKSTNRDFSGDLSIFACGLSVLKDKLGAVLVSLTSTSHLKIQTIPELRTIINLPLPFIIDSRYAKDSSIMSNGDVVIRKNETEMALVNIRGHGVKISDFPIDQLFDGHKTLPQRPTISAYQWIKGFKSVNMEDMSKLLWGDNIPGPKAPKQSEIGNLMVAGTVLEDENTEEVDNNKSKSLEIKRPKMKEDRKRQSQIEPPVTKSSKGILKNIQQAAWGTIEGLGVGTYGSKITEEKSHNRRSSVKETLIK